MSAAKTTLRIGQKTYDVPISSIDGLLLIQLLTSHHYMLAIHVLRLKKFKTHVYRLTTAAVVALWAGRCDY